MGRIRVGTSGWVYPPWRGVFYPPGLAQKRELEHLSRQVTSVEINGSFYSLQRPSSYRKWAAQTPDDFVFSLKGGRFITHLKRLRDSADTLANFFASGVLALGPKLGPVLWQLPPTLRFDPALLDEFLGELPRTTTAAAELAARHDERVDPAWTTTDLDRPVRHALEVRHPSFVDPRFPELLRAHGVAVVVADSAGRFPLVEDVTADFVYVRLHGADELYVSGYTDEGLDRWAAKVRAWSAAADVFVYFDNDAKVMAPRDAIALLARVEQPPRRVAHTIR
ncbi:DUF72 domain-containing protein [Umezawaea tangerina]|uniref:Uncharacterized protein YecE (DUF72 family) n=1 Tax=Umezawaea tangerina TaxID=84725 RepID=A0A2T0SC73_9PSEU|nr:DUF72 domain-containing protein [Umezawaea tangerina]PRY31018.1 uncharacterized protein YecE (DUF72 family) [Umezawaea tangerina]